MRLELLCDSSYLNARCMLTRAAQRAGWAQRRAELSAASLGQTDRFGGEERSLSQGALTVFIREDFPERSSPQAEERP